jgi:hypothetical protein
MSSGVSTLSKSILDSSLQGLLLFVSMYLFIKCLFRKMFISYEDLKVFFSVLIIIKNLILDYERNLERTDFHSLDDCLAFQE